MFWFCDLKPMFWRFMTPWPLALQSLKVKFYCLPAQDNNCACNFNCWTVWIFVWAQNCYANTFDDDISNSMEYKAHYNWTFWQLAYFCLAFSGVFAVWNSKVCSGFNLLLEFIWSKTSFMGKGLMSFIVDNHIPKEVPP